jgi:hypothetical protein
LRFVSDSPPYCGCGIPPKNDKLKVVFKFSLIVSC